MKRRYGSCPDEGRKKGTSWFLLFFLLIAIFFFNYFGKKLGNVSYPPIPMDVALKTPDGKVVLLKPKRDLFTVLVFVSSGCRPCDMELKEIEKLDLRWARPVVVFVDGTVPKNWLSLSEVYALFPKDIDRVVNTFGVKRVPTIFIIDGSGLIRRKIEGFLKASDLEAFLKAIKRYGI